MGKGITVVLQADLYPSTLAHNSQESVSNKATRSKQNLRPNHRFALRANAHV